MNQNDLRYIKTEDLITNAFIECAREYSLDQIHIKDICNKARISRNAFYAHYRDKYELVDHMFDRISEKILRELTPEIIRKLSRNIMYSSTEWCVQAIYENREILRILAKCSHHGFRKMISRTFIDSTLDEIYENAEKINDYLNLRMAKAYISDAATSLILIWLEDGMEMDMTEFSSLLYELSYESVAVFYRKIDSYPEIIRRKI